MYIFKYFFLINNYFPDNREFPVDISENCKGHKRMACYGHIFIKHRESKNGKVDWKCKFSAKLKCTARAHTMSYDSLFAWFSQPMHSHDIDVYTEKRVRVMLKSKAPQNLYTIISDEN